MKTLKELFEERTNFSEWKREQQELEATASTPQNDLLRRIENLKRERDLYLQKVRYELAEMEFNLTNLGGTPSKTMRKLEFEERMRKEKRRINEEFAHAVLTLNEKNVSVTSMMAMCSTTNSALFYNTIRNGTMRPTNADDGQLSVDSMEWDYSDHAPVHRYAMEKGRSFVKFHAAETEDGFVVLTYPEGRYYYGNEEVAGAYRKPRADLLLSILEETFEGELMIEPNPYGGNSNE